jgi:hypothetical protein
LFALNQALNFLKDKEGTIYADSKYAFGVEHTFGKIWAERRLMNGKGQYLIYKELIVKLLESLRLSEEIAIVLVPGYQWRGSLEAQRNNLSDKAAK